MQWRPSTLRGWEGRLPALAQHHWDRVYREKATDTVSWFQAEPAMSLELIAASGVGRQEPVIDIGAGASRLVDRLMALGFERLTALDIAARPLELTLKRLGPAGASVEWLTCDVTRWSPPPSAYALWHDRAVFHFLTQVADRAAYLAALRRGLQPGGWAVIATFGPTGPQTCSGLPVQRYTPNELADTLGSEFHTVDSRAETHVSSSGVRQDFTWCLFHRRGTDAQESGQRGGGA